MLVNQDDETTLFECPDCGQRGSVPTPVLQKALSETDDVRISCTNCPSKFSPLAVYSAPHNASDDARDDDTHDSEDDAIIDGLKANWQATDASPSAKTDTPSAGEADNDGALPAWLRPPEKKSEAGKSTPTPPQEDISEDEAPSQARDEFLGGTQDIVDDTGDDVTANSEPNPIAQADPIERVEDKPLEIDDTTASAFASPSPAPQTPPSPVPPAPADIEQAIERPATPDAPSRWDNADEDDFDEEDLEDGDIYRQPVDLLNAVQLILLTIVALLFAFSGFILLTSI